MILDERAIASGSAKAPGATPLRRTNAPRPRLTLLALGTILTTIGAWIGVLVGERISGGSALLIALFFLSGTMLLLLAVLRTPPWPTARPPATISRIGSGGVLFVTALFAVITLAYAIGFFTFSFTTSRIYDSDASAFNEFNAELVLRGKNPYTSDGLFWDAIRQFPEVGATPLHLGRYSQSVFGPSPKQLVRDVKSELANPATRGPEFSPASLHSYPSLAFLVYVPGLWLGLPTTIVTSLLFAFAFLLAAGWGAPRGTRLWLGLVLLANTLLVFWTIRGSFEVVALLPALLAWRTLDRRWLSAILLGLACAVKQIVWPLALFYEVIVWRQRGLHEASVRLGIATAAFLAPNLPYIIASPGAWLSSQLLPMTLPIFSSGIGLVGLARWNLLPLWPSAIYTLLELIAFGGLLLWFARSKVMPRPEIALVVGLLPLFVAWHSLFAYLIAIPTLATYASLELVRSDSTTLGSPDEAAATAT
jgi:hypothetical protein